MLTETELPNWAGGHRVVGVGGQTWRQVDDVGLLTDHDGWIGVQGKKNLKLSTELDSDLAGALAQLVALDAAGVPDRPPAQDLFRALDPLVDRVLILTCDEAPATITRDMARLTDRLRTWPAAVPLREAAVNGGERKAWDVLREHVVRLRSAHHGAQADETQLRALLRPLAVQGLDLRPQGRDTDRLVLRLRDMLEDSEEASKLWGRLELIGRDIAVTRSWLERDALLAELENRGFRITPVARLRRDVRRLRAVTAANLATPPSSLSIGTPEGPVSIQRAVTGLLRNHRGRLAITGDPGCGKSVLLHGLAADSDAEMVYLTHQQLRGTAGQTRTELNLQHDLVEVLAGWPGSRPALLLLDGLDQTRGTDASTWVAELADRLRGTRWSIIGTIRLFDLRHGPSWKTMFAGEPVDAEHADPDLAAVAHLFVGDLSLDELATVHAASPALQTIARNAGHRLSGLLANPFNLSLVGELLTADLDVMRIRNRLDLLRRYWNLRVNDAPSGRARTRVLRLLVTAMVVQRSQQTDDEALTETGILAILDDLLHDGVLREMPAGPWMPHRSISFAHPVLFDYAAALTVLGDPRSPDSLTAALDTDPDLSIIVRPSLDYRLAIIWHTDPNRQPFWKTALRLTTRGQGHVLAAAAAASVAARELTRPDELAELESACLHAGGTAAWNTDDAHTLAFLLAAGLHTNGTAAAFDAFGHLLETLADAAISADDTTLALSVAQLGPRAAKDNPPIPGTPAARGWVRAAVAAMTVALTDVTDPDHIRVAVAATPAITIAATLDTQAVASTIRSIISAPAIQAWGVRVVRGPITVLAAITAHDPDLGIELATCLWHTPVGTGQPVNLLGSQILRITMDSRSELEGARYHVGQAFPKIVTADLHTAARLFIAVANCQADHKREVVALPRNPRPYVRSGGSLQSTGRGDVLTTMTDALFAGLARDPDARDPVIRLLIEDLTRAEIWSLILQRAATHASTVLARALLPALRTPALFANSQTWSPAAAVVMRLAPQELPSDDRQAVHEAILNATEPAHDVPEQRRIQPSQRRTTLLAALSIREPTTPSPAPSADSSDGDGWPGERSTGEHTDLIRSADAALANSDDGDAALCALWPRLLTRHLADPQHEQLHDRVLRAGSRLAALPQTQPDTTIGEQILDVVHRILPLSSTDGSPAPCIGSPASYLVSDAITTTTRLLQHHAWQRTHGEQLRTRLRVQLDSPTKVNRVLSTAAFHLIVPDPVDRLTEIEDRLTTEPDSQVAATGVGAIASLLDTHPFQVDQSLHRLTTLRPEMFLPAPEQDHSEIHDSPVIPLVQCLTWLTVRHHTPFAEQRVQTWLTKPAEHVTALMVAMPYLRGILNPPGTDQRTEQQTAFTLYATTARHTRLAWTDPATTQNALIVADLLAQEIYHASGAFTAAQQTPDEPTGDPAVFASLALPVLTELTHVAYPAVTHHIVQTAEHLSRVTPKDALLLTQGAVTGDPGYIVEQLGVDAALDMINRCVADHRALMFGDPDCTTAVRSILEQFVRAGWPRAVDTAENLDQLFR